jgi:hypothetical protein
MKNIQIYTNIGAVYKDVIISAPFQSTNVCQPGTGDHLGLSVFLYNWPEISSGTWQQWQK